MRLSSVRFYEVDSPASSEASSEMVRSNDRRRADRTSSQTATAHATANHTKSHLIANLPGDGAPACSATMFAGAWIWSRRFSCNSVGQGSETEFPPGRACGHGEHVISTWN